MERDSGVVEKMSTSESPASIAATLCAALVGVIQDLGYTSMERDSEGVGVRDLGSTEAIMPDSASAGLTDYSRTDVLVVWYTCVNFGAGKTWLGAPARAPPKPKSSRARSGAALSLLGLTNSVTPGASPL